MDGIRSTPLNREFLLQQVERESCHGPASCQRIARIADWSHLLMLTGFCSCIAAIECVLMPILARVVFLVCRGPRTWSIYQQIPLLVLPIRPPRDSHLCGLSICTCTFSMLQLRVVSLDELHQCPEMDCLTTFSPRSFPPHGRWRGPDRWRDISHEAFY